MAGFNWVAGVEEYEDYDCGGTRKVGCFSLEVAGFEVRVTAGHWGEDQGSSSWAVYRDGEPYMVPDKRLAHVSRHVCGGHCSDRGIEGLTHYSLEDAGAWLLKEVGEEALVSAGVYEVPEPFDLERELEEEAIREAEERSRYR